MILTAKEDRGEERKIWCETGDMQDSGSMGETAPSMLLLRLSTSGPIDRQPSPLSESSRSGEGRCPAIDGTTPSRKVQPTRRHVLRSSAANTILHRHSRMNTSEASSPKVMHTPVDCKMSETYFAGDRKDISGQPGLHKMFEDTLIASDRLYQCYSHHLEVNIV